VKILGLAVAFVLGWVAVGWLPPDEAVGRSKAKKPHRPGDDLRHAANILDVLESDQAPSSARLLAMLRSKGLAVPKILEALVQPSDGFVHSLERAMVAKWPYRNDEQVLAIVESAARVDSRAALEAVDALFTDGPHRKQAYQTLFSSWAIEDFDAAKRASDELSPGPDKSAAVHGICAQWPEVDVIEKALWLAGQLGQPDEIDAILGEHFKFAEIPPDGAWIAEIASKEVQDLMRIRMVSQQPDIVGEGAQAMIQECSSSKAKACSVIGLANKYQDQDDWIGGGMLLVEWSDVIDSVDFSVEWRETMRKVISGAVDEWSRPENQLPVDRIAEFPSDLWNQVSSRLMDAQPIDLQDRWVRARLEGESINNTEEPLWPFYLWYQHEPEAAAKWVAESAPGSFRDRAVRLLYDKVIANNPATALAWAQSISEPSLNERLTRVALRHWIDENQDTAWDAIRSAKLSPEARASLVSRLPR
jgi:hypothetical protein